MPDDHLSYFFQISDDYLFGLATRYASELGIDQLDVLHHLDNFRQISNEKMIPATSTLNRNNGCPNSPFMSSHTYANLHHSEKFSNTNGSRVFLPGVYAVSFLILHYCKNLQHCQIILRSNYQLATSCLSMMNIRLSFI